MNFKEFKEEFDRMMENLTEEDLIKEFEDLGYTFEKIMRLKEISDIPENWKVLTVRKKTTVKIRDAVEVERFKVSWSDSELVSDPELDVIVISEDGREYPCKMDIFFESYSPLTEDKWIKKGTHRIVEIPEGTKPFEVETLEGIVGEVGYPDYVAIGVKGELYVNTRTFVDNQLEILS